MISFSENKVSIEELKIIFKSNIDRTIFIVDYPYFHSDGNADFYNDFINENILSTRYKLQEDAIELSIAIHYFRMTYLEIISKIVYSRRGW